jgi:hypothetical protein
MLTCRQLTYLLQYSLGGNSKTLMFVMISPLQAHLSETITSLKFATKVSTNVATERWVADMDTGSQHSYWHCEATGKGPLADLAVGIWICNVSCDNVILSPLDLRCFLYMINAFDCLTGDILRYLLWVKAHGESLGVTGGEGFLFSYMAWPQTIQNGHCICRNNPLE